MVCLLGHGYVAALHSCRYGTYGIVSYRIIRYHTYYDDVTLRYDIGNICMYELVLWYGTILTYHRTYVHSLAVCVRLANLVRGVSALCMHSVVIAY